jgi:hypothetical protein
MAYKKTRSKKKAFQGSRRLGSGFAFSRRRRPAPLLTQSLPPNVRIANIEDIVMNVRDNLGRVRKILRGILRAYERDPEDVDLSVKVDGIANEVRELFASEPALEAVAEGDYRLLVEGDENAVNVLDELEDFLKDVKKGLREQNAGMWRGVQAILVERLPGILGDVDDELAGLFGGLGI